MYHPARPSAGSSCTSSDSHFWNDHPPRSNDTSQELAYRCTLPITWRLIKTHPPQEVPVHPGMGLAMAIVARTGKRRPTR
jgi:hypothetical protein